MDAEHMTRENKLALIIGFGLVLVVGILVSDHFSTAHRQEAADLSTEDTSYSERRLGDPEFLTMVYPGEAGRDESLERGPGEARQTSPPLLQNGTRGSVDRDDNASARATGENPGSSPRGAPSFLLMPGQADLIAGDRRPDPLPTDLPRSYTLYTVRPGESLARIAREKYGDESLWRKLAEINADRIPNPSVVRAGVTIRLPKKEELSGLTVRDTPRVQPRRGDPPSSSERSGPRRFKKYTVKKGDILGRIARKQLGTSKRWREIYELNRDLIKDPDNVPAGIVIRIPID